MKELMKLMYVCLCGIIMTMGVVSCGGDDDDDNSITPQGSNIHYYEADSDEDYTPMLVGTWYYMETGTASSVYGELGRVSLFLLTFNSDGTWSKVNRNRSSYDNYVETIPGIDFDGTFTLESNNIVAMMSSGSKYATWNFSPAALRQGTLKIMVRDDYATTDEDVERLEFQRYNYSSIDDALNEYIAQKMAETTETPPTHSGER